MSGTIYVCSYQLYMYIYMVHILIIYIIDYRYVKRGKCKIIIIIIILKKITQIKGENRQYERRGKKQRGREKKPERCTVNLKARQGHLPLSIEAEKSRVIIRIMHIGQSDTVGQYNTSQDKIRVVRSKNNTHLFSELFTNIYKLLPNRLTLSVYES